MGPLAEVFYEVARLTESMRVVRRHVVKMESRLGRLYEHLVAMDVGVEVSSTDENGPEQKGGAMR